MQQTAIAFTVTYSPAHHPNGTPIDPHASRQTLAERKTATQHATSAQAATDMFERDTGRMVVGCTRLHIEREGAGA